MQITTLRKVGGSIMLAVSPALLDVLKLRAGAKVGLAVRQGSLVVGKRQAIHRVGGDGEDDLPIPPSPGRRREVGQFANADVSQAG